MEDRDVGERIRRARCGLPPVAAPDFDATEGAMDLARAKGLDLRPFVGRGSGRGGRIYVQDVERWVGEG